MIEDAATDTVNINNAVALNLERQPHLDSLAYLCANHSGKDAEDASFYRHWSFGLNHPEVISPTERTMQQLKSGGGMRLIKIKSAVDSIVSYEDAAKKLADQQGYCKYYLFTKDGWALNLDMRTKVNIPNFTQRFTDVALTKRNAI